MSEKGEPEKRNNSPEVRKSAKKADPKSKLFQLDRKPLIVSSSPHLHTQDSVPKIMWTVAAALVPTSVMGVVYFGLPALRMVLVCVGASLATEAVINRMKGESLTLTDGSAVITGLLLALTLPPSFSLFGGILGAIFAIAIGKQVFGGLGYNIFNPALLGRAFLQASFPVSMTTWTYPQTARYAGIDAISAATPLGQFKFERITTDTWLLITGNIGGCIGETCSIAIIIGGVFLLAKKYVDWRIIVSYLGSVFVVAGIFWLVDASRFPSPVFHLFSGGLMLGAFFMATDPITCPITPKGSWIFGIGAGLFLVLIRLYGGLPEGVMYSILLMNGVTPLINRYTRPKFFGEASS